MSWRWDKLFVFQKLEKKTSYYLYIKDYKGKSIKAFWYMKKKETV